MSTQIFVNLPVTNLDKSKDFFNHLGFTLNPQYTDKKAACFVIGPNIYLMILTQDFFKTFVTKDIADTTKFVESITALSADSRQQVDDLLTCALAAGATIYRQPDDHDGMYSRSFQDIDGHLWEIIYMDQT